MGQSKRSARPLSPFMLGPYYRLQLTSVTSIITRITGNGLIVSTLLIVWWLFAMTRGGDYYTFVDGIIHSWLGKIILTLSLWAVWYHYLAGLRHLIFDAGRGLDLPTATKLGWGVIIGSVVLTVLTFFVI